MEDLFLAELERLAPHLPTPRRWVKGLIPSRNFEADFYWSRVTGGLVVEVDGGQFMPGGGKHGTPEDIEKCNLLMLHGYSLLRFSGTMIKNDPYTCIQMVEAFFTGKVSEIRKGLWKGSKK